MIKITNISEFKLLLRVMISGHLEISSGESAEVKESDLIQDYHKYLSSRNYLVSYTKVEETMVESQPVEDPEVVEVNNTLQDSTDTDTDYNKEPETVEYTEDELKSMHYTQVDTIVESLGLPTDGNKNAKIKLILDSQK